MNSNEQRIRKFTWSILRLSSFLFLCFGSSLGCKKSSVETQTRTSGHVAQDAPLSPLEPMQDNGGVADTAQVAPAGGLAESAQPNQVSLSDFVFPLENGFFGSGWCVCRDIGSSPHVGQDINADGEEVSLAVSDGQVRSISFETSCGYAVEFSDALGAIWVYRHLDRPALEEGQWLKTGQKIGVHNKYPTVGCGTGAHLHIERHSRGTHRGDGAGHSSERMRACQFGVRSCYFDPTIVKNAKKSSGSQGSLALTAAENFGDQSLGISALTDSIPDSEPCTRAVLSEMHQEDMNIAQDEGLLTVAVAEPDRLDSPADFRELSVFLKTDQQQRNSCRRKSGGADCIVQLALLARDKQGNTYILAEATGLANKVPKLQMRNRFCSSLEDKTAFVQAKTARAETHLKVIRLKGE